jgi:Opioid growth factor receptor (OGFr) conserved region
MSAKHPLHAFLAGSGRDGQGRTIDDVLAFSDDELESVHDYIQWLFPLPTRSAAQPGAPVLSGSAIASIRADPGTLANFSRAANRMLKFYNETEWWLAGNDHNHLRITRIIQSLRILLGADAAHTFYNAVMTRHGASGSPADPRNVAYWSRALSI